MLVRIRAVSLNARDLMILHGPQPYGPKPDIIPVSDGAGEVVACGSAVSDLKPGTRIVLPFRPGWIDGPFKPADAATDWETNADKAAMAKARRDAVREQMKERGESRKRDRIDVD